MRAFITGTGTGVGKTLVTRALTLALRRAGGDVAALKPAETGCTTGPLDARLLADSCGRPELADAPGLYRASLPAAPYAATLAGEPPPPPLAALAASVDAAAGHTRHLLVEGAGGPFVPYDREYDLLDLALRLDLPLLLVTEDRLGVLSHTLAAARAIAARGATLRAVVLNRFASVTDPSTDSNLHILRERLPGTPVCHFTPAGLTEASLVSAIRASQVLAAFDPQHHF